MENKAMEIKNKVESLIEVAKSRFTGEWDKAHEVRLAKIEGMLQALEILTGKEYCYDENGVYEK